MMSTSIAAQAMAVPAEPVNARLLEALIQCRDRFLFYVEHHLANGAAVKAAENDRFVTLANQAIAAAEAQQERLLQDMHDAGREIDRVMADTPESAAEAELERERIRLAACGVVAMADTPESAARARDMREEYRSASCDDVARRVDECMALRAERDALAAKLKEVDGRIDDLLATCHRLALELECLLLDTKDSAPVSRWWDSAMAALDGWHKAKDAASARPVPAEPVNARLLEALRDISKMCEGAGHGFGGPAKVAEDAGEIQQYDALRLLMIGDDYLRRISTVASDALTAAEAQQAELVDERVIDGPDAPYPGMIAAFETHYGQSFRDKAWRTEAACWAAAWSKATARAEASLAEPQPDADGWIRWGSFEVKLKSGASFVGNESDIIAYRVAKP